MKAKETSEKMGNDTDYNNKCETGAHKCEYLQTIDHVVSLLQEEIDQLDCLNDELTEDSQVWQKFKLQQTCFERLLEHALEEQKRINEIWGSELSKTVRKSVPHRGHSLDEARNTFQP